MSLGFKPVLMLGLVFTLTPSPIDAAPPAPNRARQFPAVHVFRSKVKGIRVAARLDSKSKGEMAVKLDLRNPSKKNVTAKLRVDVYERRPSSRYARMVPPPIHHGSKTVSVKLGPNQKLSKRIVIKKGRVKHLSRFYTSVRKAPNKARARRSHARRRRARRARSAS